MPVVNHAASDVVLGGPTVIDQGLGDDFAGQFLRGDFRFLPHLLGQEADEVVVAPAEWQALAAQARLADAVGGADNPVA